MPRPFGKRAGMRTQSAIAGGAVQLFALRDDVLAHIVSFANVATLATLCGISRKLRKMATSHENWRWYVLQFFGVYYEDYMRSIDVHDEYRWHRLFVYIRKVHHSVDRKKGSRRCMPRLLRACDDAAEEESMPSASLSSSTRGRCRRRRYRGSLELADNCNIFFWENGRTVQVIDARDGKILREIDTGQTFRRYFHRLANVKNRLFVCLNDCIKVWEYGPDDLHRPPVELPPPKRLPLVAKVSRPLELLVHRRRLILLESNCCLLWDTSTYEFVCCIVHDYANEDVESISEASPAAPAGIAADALAPPLAPPGQALPQAAAGFARNRSDEEWRALEVQWMGDLIVTWVRSASHSLKVWSLEGQHQAHLRMESPLVQVDVARVTWVSIQTLDHFILAALDSRSVISLWDSQSNFSPLYRFYCGCEEPFDLVLTQDFMAVINDSFAENLLELTFWKLWFHPDFDKAGDQSEPSSGDDLASCIRSRSVALGGTPAGSVFAPAAPAAHGGELSREQLKLYLQRELRPNARPVKKLSLSDVDSYFASYRNFLNVCSFHKSGQESLSVYRSSSLQKKIFFPPAKHTKFEEWLALQVHNDGTVVMHDFRPDGIAFDELVPEVLCDPDTDRKDHCVESIDHSRRRNEAQHTRPSHGSRSRAH